MTGWRPGALALTWVVGMAGFYDTNMEEKTGPTYTNQEDFEKFRNKMLRQEIWLEGAKCTLHS